MADWYGEHYSSVTATADGSVFHTYMHRAMERRYGPQASFPRVLEVGGNRGEHIPFVRHQFTDYLVTDLRLPVLPDQLSADSRIRAEACDVLSIPQRDGTFDRVIATCLLHHVDSPLMAAREMRRVVRPGGQITILLPTDPGLAYRVGKAVTSGRAARRAGLGDRYKLIGAIDHRNHFQSIKEQLRYAFRPDTVGVDWYPFRLPSMSLNAFAVFTIVTSSVS
ncbi:class I SAM-dependent methyltransferase [Jatrophihabitans cynanchi]|uniref:Class I SAM-dependent methyltransferase n=1 Tax=Jatrophihabitans cynanchi TaxID=2944128 RepID=A0ABY7JVI5_9ACTN|nr:class I SAM-dependent methyltransferase [Jatrophihabitans sp. SB3-54]WAX56015.1 class I SAM-dependent methyltransferase [Jatrophihabitans sp. SB3-54]